MSDSSNNRAQFALLASVLGILVVVAALYLLFPQTSAPVENKYGRTEEALRDEYNRLLRKAGLSTEYTRCRYYPKSLTLSCEVPPLKEANLFAAMAETGWKASTQDKSESALFVKEGYAVSISCPSNRAAKPCAITFQAGASTGA